MCANWLVIAHHKYLTQKFPTKLHLLRGWKYLRRIFFLQLCRGSYNNIVRPHDAPPYADTENKLGRWTTLSQISCQRVCNRKKVHTHTHKMCSKTAFYMCCCCVCLVLGGFPHSTSRRRRVRWSRAYPTRLNRPFMCARVVCYSAYILIAIYYDLKTASTHWSLYIGGYTFVHYTQFLCMTRGGDEGPE